LPVVDQPLDPQQLGRPEASASSQPYRRQPELRAIRLTLDVDVRRLDAIRRVEENRYAPSRRTVGTLRVYRARQQRQSGDWSHPTQFATSTAPWHLWCGASAPKFAQPCFAIPLFRNHSVWLTIAFQPRRIIIAPAADGDKRMLSRLRASPHHVPFHR
jgi:hypothetical protein